MKFLLWAQTGTVAVLFATAAIAAEGGGCKSMWIPDFKSIVGKWEGTYYSSGTNRWGPTALTVNDDGTWRASSGSEGTSKLIGGQLRFQSAPPPAGSGRAGSMTLEDCNGQKRLVAITDDNTIRSDLTPAK